MSDSLIRMRESSAQRVSRILKDMRTDTSRKASLEVRYARYLLERMLVQMHTAYDHLNTSISNNLLPEEIQAASKSLRSASGNAIGITLHLLEGRAKVQDIEGSELAIRIWGEERWAARLPPE